jgi:hypothetical protein
MRETLLIKNLLGRPARSFAFLKRLPNGADFLSERLLSAAGKAHQG